MSDMTPPPSVVPGGSVLLGSMRDAWCGELRAEHDGLDVVLCGWVDGTRDLGGLHFVDLRDRTGLVQVVMEPDEPEALEAAHRLRNEFAVRVTGTVRPRQGAANPDLATGDVEVRARRLEVLAPSEVPPFVVGGKNPVSEELRLEYRYLDLRRPEMQSLLALRHRAVQAGRAWLDRCGLLDVETPILFKSTPEGARDYLVPSRVHPGRFYALPQSPQVLKQVLMVAGCDGYYQMARCFRDEDLRANRQPEFTQMDMEISFCVEEDVFRITEGYVAALWSAGGREIDTPFRHLTWADAMERYGTDKPDLRFGMEMVSVTELLATSGFRVVAGAAERGEVVRALAAPGGAAFSRKDIDDLSTVATRAGAAGLAWIKVGAGQERFSGPPVKFMETAELERLAETTGAEDGALVLLVVGPPRVSAAALGAVRLELGERLGLRPSDRWVFAWVRDFPLFEADDAGRLSPAHHPFCMPHDDDMGLLEKDPAAVRARSYDLTCNGEELGSGSVRIHRRDVQSRVFASLGIGEDEARARFGFFLDALGHGAPPHAGIALGLDRLIMLLAEKDSIREVLPFPKTLAATDLMSDSPSEVSQEQLRELHVKVIAPERD